MTKESSEHFSAHMQIEIVGEKPNKRNYCRYPQDSSITTNLTILGIIEEQLEGKGISSPLREGYIVAHTMIWQSIPDEYKSELCDATYL